MSRVPFLITGATLLTFCIGCSGGGPTLPDATLGDWGSTRFSVQATETSVVFRLSCSGVYASEPLRLDADGRFSLDGELRTAQGPAAVPVTVRGVVRGDTLEVEVSAPRGTDGAASRYSAVRNQPRDEGGIYCVS